MSKPTLLVLAAGMGSRYGGLKQMAGVGPHGETLLEYAVHDALKADFGQVVFVIRRDFANAFQEEVVARLPRGAAVELAFQETASLPDGCVAPEGRTKPWGTGHAVWSARAVVNEPFAVINADDYYGPSAYRQAAEFVRTMPASTAPRRFGLVAFELGRTLSPHGTVSRGICEVDDAGYLVGVTETTGVQGSGEAIVSEDSTASRLTATTPASMNFFVFQPSIFASLEAQFRIFFAARGGEAKAEFFLPSAVATMIERGEARVSVMRSAAQWMGVTYAEDRADVVARLAALHEQGVYPPRLG